MKVLQVNTYPTDDGRKLTRIAVQTGRRKFGAFEGQHKDAVDEVRFSLIAAVGRKLSEAEARRYLHLPSLSYGF